jgi:hypothetical protein
MESKYAAGDREEPKCSPWMHPKSSMSPRKSIVEKVKYESAYNLNMKHAPELVEVFSMQPRSRVDCPERFAKKACASARK